VRYAFRLGGAALAAYVVVVPSKGATRDVAAEATESRRVPRLLSETGLYRPDGSVDPRNRPFFPQYPLWSDGADKSRWIRLPEEATIDVTDVDAWRFPPGTTFWKEFAWGGRKVETRMIRVEASGKGTFATYVWNEDQSDAVVAPVEGLQDVFEVAPKKRHSIPSVVDCAACHEPAPAVALGFTALQLSDDRDPLAPHAALDARDGITLRRLVEDGLMFPRRSELVRRPPRIRAADPVARAAIGYLSANCGGCHNSRGPLARLGLSLLHDEAGAPVSPEPAVVTAVGRQSRFVLPGVAPERSFFVAPGAPDLSVVVHRMTSRLPSSQMPPLGTVIRDEAAIVLVRRWIESLRPPADKTVQAGDGR
jgi:hypothetical protein